MSVEDVELLRRAYAAYEQGDGSVVFDLIAPDAEIRRFEPDNRAWRGPEGLAEAAAEWTHDFDRFEMSGAEFIEAGADVVVVRVHQVARGKASGASVEGDFWFVHTLADGKVVRLEMHADKDAAFAAAGLDAGSG